MHTIGIIVNYQYVTPMINFSVDKDIEINNIAIFKKISLSELKNMGFDIEKCGFNTLEINQWETGPILAYGTNESPTLQKFERFVYNISLWYDKLLLLKSNLCYPIINGPSFAKNMPQDLKLIYHSFLHLDYGQFSKITLNQNEFIRYKKMDEKYKSFFLEPSDNKLMKQSQFAHSILSEMRSSFKKPERFVFSCIALESLLSMENAELSYRISNRAALLIGDTNNGRKSVFNKVKKIYDLRSKIVHGVIKDVKTDDLCMLQEIVRVVILKTMSLSDEYDTKEKLLKTMDGCLYDDELRKDISTKSKKLFDFCDKLGLDL